MTLAIAAADAREAAFGMPATRSIDSRYQYDNTPLRAFILR